MLVVVTEVNCQKHLEDNGGREDTGRQRVNWGYEQAGERERESQRELLVAFEKAESTL